MKQFIEKLVNLYNTNSKFHSFVLAVEYAGASFVTEAFATGQLPTSKKALVAFGIGLGGAVIAAVKRWMATNVGTQNLQMKQ